MEKEELSSMKLWKPCGSKKVNIIKMMIREIFTYERPLRNKTFDYYDRSAAIYRGSLYNEH